MWERLRNVLALLRAQLWLIPTLMSLAAVGLAVLLLASSAEGPKSGALAWVFNGDPDTARNLLSSLLSGLMTMTSLVVSITFVILTLASSQLGPRLVASFISDRQIQLVIGLFLGTTLYVLIVLRSLSGGEISSHLPDLAVTLATVLTALCLIALLFYIHKVAHGIVADTVIARVYDQFEEGIGELEQRSQNGQSSPDVVLATPPQKVGIGKVGYIQTIDYDSLVELACKRDLVLRIAVRAGQFVLGGGAHVLVHGCTEAPDDKLCDEISQAFVIGSSRSPAQDLEFSVRQLVEIALRALSPGINDPFTAIAVLDRLGAGIEQMSFRALRPMVYRDGSESIRVLADRTELAGLVEASFAPIRQAASEHPPVLMHLAETIAKLRYLQVDDAVRTALLAQLTAVDESVRTGSLVSADREAVLAKTAAAAKALAPGP